VVSILAAISEFEREAHLVAHQRGPQTCPTEWHSLRPQAQIDHISATRGIGAACCWRKPEHHCANFQCRPCDYLTPGTAVSNLARPVIDRGASKLRRDDWGLACELRSSQSRIERPGSF
jgi:hypothetical protein